MNSDEREHWTRLMLQRSTQGEPLVRPAYCRLLSIYSPAALSRNIREGNIPTILIGKCVYVVESVIADWIVAKNLGRYHSAKLSPLDQEKTNHDPTRGHPMDDLPPDIDVEIDL